MGISAKGGRGHECGCRTFCGDYVFMSSPRFARLRGFASHLMKAAGQVKGLSGDVMSLLNAWRFVAVSFLTAWLVACGGGGGDSGSDSSFSVSFDTQALSFSYMEDSYPTVRTVTATGHGTVPSAGVYIGATVSGEGIQQPIYVSIDETTNKAFASITPMYGLLPGTYTGTIRLLACINEVCSKHYPGSPHSMSYSITVLPRLKANPTGLSYSLSERAAGEPKTVSVVLPEGDTSTQLQVTYGYGASDWLQVQNNGSSLLVTPQIAGVAPGNYVAYLKLTGSSGTQQITVPVSLSVAYDPSQHLSLNKSSVSFSGAEGRILPTETIQVSVPPASSGVAASITYGAGASGWLQVQKTGNSLVLTVNTVGVAPGSYSASLKVIDALTNESVTVPVALTVAYDALLHLRADQSSLAFVGVETQTLPAKILEFGLPVSATGLATSISYGTGASAWLQAQKSGGSLSISANTSGMVPGTYAANLTLQATGTTETLTVPITLTLGKGLLALPAEALGINLGAAGSGSFAVQAVSGVTATQWAASSNCAWFVLDNASGGFGQSVQWHIDPDLFEALPNNAEHLVDVTIAVDGMSNTTKKITVRKQFQEIKQIDTLALMAGEGGEVLLYGVGFAGVGNLADHLYISGGLVPEAITVRSNTVASVNLQNVPAGSYTIALKSAMGSMSHKNTLQVMAHQDFAYQAIATGGKKGDLVWDPVSRSAFVPDKELARIHRFQWNGTTFVHTAKSTSASYSLGMTRDLGKLVVATRDGNIQFYDPITMDVISTSTIGSSLPEVSNLPLSISGDNDLWIATEPYLNAAWNDLLRINLDTGAAQEISGDGYSFYYGPWGVVSPNGNRMMMSQTASSSPSPPPLQLDVMAGYFSMFAMGKLPSFFTTASSNRLGTRWLLDRYEVYNFAMDKQGNIVSPSGWYFRDGAMSDDGTRAYLYAFANDAINADGYSESTSPAKPRIYVYDTNSLSASQTDYPLLGYIEMADYAGCRAVHYPCDYTPHVALSRDGHTFFIVGDRNFVVVPIPAAYQQGQPTTGGAGAIVGVRASHAARPKPPAEMRRWYPIKP